MTTNGNVTAAMEAGNGDMAAAMEAQRDRETTDIAFAAYLLTQGYTITGLSGLVGRTCFCFDKPIPPSVFLRFTGSPEKQLLDAFRSLKIMVVHRR